MCGWRKPRCLIPASRSVFITSHVPLFCCAGALPSILAVWVFICEAQAENSSEGGGSVWVYAPK